MDGPEPGRNESVGAWARLPLSDSLTSVLRFGAPSQAAHEIRPRPAVRTVRGVAPPSLAPALQPRVDRAWVAVLTGRGMKSRCESPQLLSRNCHAEWR